MHDLIRVTDDTTTDDLLEALGHLNTVAKATRRRGPIGTRTPAYAAQHERINAVLDEWQAATAKVAAG